jgi:hypothetical protein
MRAAAEAGSLVCGLYAWWLVNGDALPQVPATPHPFESAGLLYLGIGPNSAGSKRSLSDRFNDHTKRNTGNSTFRLDLASFLFEREGWQPYWTDRAVLTRHDNLALSMWQATNLRVQWITVAEPWRFETTVIASMRPPLNRRYNKSHPFYEAVGRSRHNFRAAARARI